MTYAIRSWRWPNRRGSRVAAVGALALWPALTVAQVPPDTTGWVPAGYGTLRQNDISITISDAAVRLRITPLDEGVLRLLAPDSHQSLSGIRTSVESRVTDAAHRSGIDAGTQFLVTVFGLEDQARFDPNDVTIVSRNRFFRAAAVVPLSPNWSANTVSQRGTASAVFVYEPGLALLEPMTFQYGGVTADGWRRIAETLERERSRVVSRIRNPPREPQGRNRTPADIVRGSPGRTPAGRRATM